MAKSIEELQSGAKRSRQKAAIAQAAYDKPGYGAAKRESLRQTNEALAANERVKEKIDRDDPGGAARNRLRSSNRSAASAGRAAERAILGARRNNQSTDSNQ